jgi:hypothetical protein
MLIPLAVAIEPNDCPGRTVQNVGPGGLAFGLGGRGGYRHRFRRCPGVSAFGLTLGLYAWSRSIDNPVFAAINPSEFPGRTVQYGGSRCAGAWVDAWVGSARRN